MFPFDFSPFPIQVAGAVLRAGSLSLLYPLTSVPPGALHASQEDSSEHRGGTLDTISPLPGSCSEPEVVMRM